MSDAESATQLGLSLRGPALLFTSTPSHVVSTSSIYEEATLRKQDGDIIAGQTYRTFITILRTIIEETNHDFGFIEHTKLMTSHSNDH